MMRLILSRFFFTSVLSLLSFASLSQTTIYVDINAVGANNGTTWFDGYNNLETALTAATAGDELWVAQGIYVPATNFNIPSNVKVYGGFSGFGTETLLTERNIQFNLTTLSGDVNGDDIISTPFPTLVFGNRVDNRSQIVRFDNVGNLSVLDGFTISGGENAVSAGGGMLVQYCSPTIRNIRFENNGGINGGAVAVFADNAFNSASPSFLNCQFTTNAATTNGGAIFINATETTATTSIINSTFSENTAANGAAVYNTQSTGTIVTNLYNSIFYNNSASLEGLSLFIQDAPTVTVNFQNSLFEEVNSGSFGGAGVNSNIIDLGATLFNQDPLFVDPANADFSLQNGSPAENTGDETLLTFDTDDVDQDGNVSEYFPIDINGKKRNLALQVDMGAIETSPLTMTVQNTSDLGDGSLREAIVNVANGGTILFDPSLDAMTIQLQTTLTVVKNMNFDSEGIEIRLNGDVDGSLTNNSGDIRIMIIDEGLNVNIKGLTFEFGYIDADIGGALVINSGCNVNLTECKFYDNAAVSTGGSGGALVVAISNIEIDRCVFENNTAVDGAGALYQVANDGSLITANIYNSSFTNNQATGSGAFGGAIVISSTSNGVNATSTTIYNTTFDSNSAEGNGGAVFLGNSFSAPTSTNTFTLSNNTFHNNNSITSNFGDAIFVGAQGDLSLYNTLIANTESTSVIIGGGGSISLSSNNIITQQPSVFGAINTGTLLLSEIINTSLMTDGSSQISYLELALPSIAIDAGSNAQILPDIFDLDADIDTGEGTPIDAAGNPRAWDPSTSSAGTVDIGAVESQVAPPPTAPTSLIAYESGGDIILEWVDSPDESNYDIESSADYFSGFSNIASDIGVDQTTYTVTSGSSQFYRVIAKNAGGIAESNSEFATTDAFPGQALSFNGTASSNVSLGDASTLDFSNQFTFEGWVYRNPGSAATLFEKWNETNTEIKSITVSTTGSISATLYGLAPNFNISTGSLVSENTWTHIAVTYNGSVFRIYVDGLLQTNVTTAGNITNGEGIAYLGANPESNSSNTPLNGNMDEVRIWNVAKTSFSDRFASLTGNEANLVAYYPFDESSGNITVDRSQNNADGTINGGVSSIPSTFLVPFAPTNLIAYESVGNIILDWTDNATNETGFLVERADDYNFTTNVFDITSAVGNPGVDATSVTYDPASTDYYYRVTALNGFENALSQSSVEFATTGSFPGQALSFNGSSHVDLGTDLNVSLDGTNQLTLEAWIYPTSAAGNEQVIMGSYDAASTMQYLVRFDGVSGRLFFFIGTGVSTFQTLTGTTSSIPLNTWSHIAATYDGANMKLFINGVQDGSDVPVITTLQPATGIAATIGGLGASQYFTGQIDEVKVWSADRSGLGFSDRFNSIDLNANPTGLLAYFPFDEGAGTTTVDRSININDGAINGATWVISDFVDVTPPTLTSVSIGMDPTGNVNYARTGDVIDIAFTSDEDITNVTASMLSGGNALTNSAPGVSGGPTNWNIRYGTTGTDTDGAFTFTIDYEDLTGNAGTQVTTVTDGSFVILNNTAPVISASSLSADNLTLTVDFDEDIFSDSDGLTAVALGNFALSQSGGVATASATSINVVSGTQVEITLSISGNSNGLEVITVEPNALIYNAAGVDMLGGQANNSVSLNDITAPTLSGLSLSSFNYQDADISISSDEAGTLYYVFTQSAVQPSAIQILNGQDENGIAADVFNNFSEGSANTYSYNIGALTATTTYHMYWIAEDAAGNQSNVVSASFTTDALPVGLIFTTNPVPSIPLNAGSSNNLIYQIQMDVSGGTATMIGMFFAPNGTYAESDFVQFNYYESRGVDDFGSSSLISSNGFFLGDGQIPDGYIGLYFSNTYTDETVYWYITADISSGATVSNTFGLDLPEANNNFGIDEDTNETDGGLAISEVFTIQSGDTTPPSVALSSLEADPTASGLLVVDIAFSEVVTGLLVSNVVVGNGIATNLIDVDGQNYMVDITPSSDGLVTVDLGGSVAQDLAGNDNTGATQFSITSDQTAPVITFDQDGLETNDIFLTGAVDDVFATVSISLDGGSTYDPVTNNGDGTWTYDLSANGSYGGDGFYAIDLDVIDLSGNFNLLSGASVTIDQTAPVITFDQDGLETNDIFLTGAVDDAFATVSISLDGGSIYDPVTNNGDGTWTYDLSTNGSFGGDGFYAIDLDVIDLSGNFNLLSGASVTIDQTAPVITFDQDGLETNDVFLSGTVDDASATVSISLDGGSIYDPVTNNGDGTWTYDLSTNGSFGGDGFYAIDLDVIDLSGNFNLLSGASVTIDQTAPVITFDQDGLETNDVFLSGTVDDASATVSISLDGGSIYDPVTNNGDGTWTYDLSANGSFGGDGLYSIDLDVIDLSGNFNLLSGASVTIDQTAPVITFDQDGLETNDIFLTGAVDDAFATVSISLDGGSIYDPVTNNGDGTWTYDLSANGSFGGDGLYSIDLDVIDLSGNFNLLSGASVTIDQTAPVITFDQDGLETNDIFLTGAVDDAFATVSISLDGGSIYDPVTNNGDGTWTYDLSTNGSFGGDGFYAIDLDVIDLSGNFNLLSGASVTIDQTAPVITFDQDGLETNDVFLSGTVDDASATVSISLDGGSTYDPVTNNGDGTWIYDLSTNGSYGGDGFYPIDLDVIDLSGNFNLLSGASVTIDQTAPAFTSTNTASADENSAIATVIYTAVATDAGTVTYSLSGTDAAAFALDGSTGELTFVSSPDFETQASYEVVITATDNATNSTDITVTVTINDLDEDTPVFTSLTTASADENSAITTVVYTAVATDAGTITYSLSGTDAAAFALDGSSGELTFVSSPDFETQVSYEVVITATDDATNNTDLTVTITVNDLDEDAPSFTSATTAAADENSAIATVIYTAVATDVGTITYSLSGTDAAAFALDGSTGELTFVSSPDFETQASYEVVITATDDATNSTDITVTVTINDLDEDTPVFTSLTTASADENSAITTVVYTAVATDAGTVTYSLSGTDAAAFALDGSTGELTFISSPDFETQASYEVVITGIDDATNNTDITVTVTINDLDEDTPVFTSLTTASADENSAITTVVYTAVATDAGTVTYSLSGTDAAAFALDGSTGELTFVSSPDFETQVSYEVVITATDDATNSTDITVTVTINDLDEDTPVFTSLTTASADENSAITTVIYTAVATDAGTVTYSLSGTDAAAFALDGSTGELTFVSSPDFETQVSYEVVITATDDATNNTDITVTVTINDLDEDTPVFTSLTTASADENSAIATVIYTAVATDAGTVTYSLSGTDAAAFALDGSSGELTFVSSPDFETQASYEVVITATDDATNSTDITVTVTINDLDEDTPVFTSLTTASADENSAITTVIYTAVATDAGVVTYSLSGTDAAAFALDGSSGELTFVSSPDFETQSSYEVVITATDDATNSTDITVTVTVNDLDEDAPTVMLSSLASDPTNATVIELEVVFSESVTGLIAGDFTVSNGVAGNLQGSGTTYTVDITPDADGILTVDLAAGSAQDAAGNDNTAAIQFSITVDQTLPTVVISSIAPNPTNAAMVLVDVTFGGSVTGFEIGDITITNGTASNFTGSGTTYSVDITPTADGAVTVDVPAGVAQDASGNDNVAAVQFMITSDRTAPVVTVDITGTSLASPSLSGTINENATMTVEVNSMSYTPMISGNTWSIAEGVITPDLTDGTYEVVATATDAAGNVGVDDTEDELTISQTVVALQASKITSSSFQANWSAGESDVIGYELDVSVDGFTTFVSGYNAKSLSNTVTSEVVTDLDFRTDYSYRVRLVNSGGAQGNSNTRTVTTIIKPETEDDFAALQIIYTETGGPSWTNQKSWLATRLQDWEDVTIDPTTQRVTGVNLSNNNLTGSFPLTLDLDQLTTLNLSGNNLNNLADLSELASLSNLDVSVNALAFDDLELVAGISTISYADQASIQFNESNTNANPIEVRYTGDYQLSVTLGGSANSYQWLRNGEAITNGEDFFINGSDNTILEIDYDNMGTFTVEVTSPLVSGLTINVDAQKVLAIANMTVEVRNSEGDLLPEMVDGYLLETIRLAKGYDTLEVAENAGSTFVFPDVVLGNYLMAADSDPEKYVPTYFGEGEIVEWDKAETVLFRSDDAIQLQMTEIPVELKEGDGDGKLDIVIEEDLDGNTGRVEARRRAARRKCGLRRKTGGGRTDEDADGFSLIAYGETDDNGEFQFGFLPEGTYRFFVEYPGIPLDDDSFVQFEVGEAGISDTDFKLEAFASEDGLEVNIEVVLGVILDYFKDLSVYPNPADKGLFIKYRHLKSRDVTAELVDLTGATKWSQELSSGYNGDIEIDVRDMEEGVYILYLYDRESRDENVVSYRVIVQH